MNSPSIPLKEAARRLGACSEALDWLEAQSDTETAWNTCERADWMLWVVRKIGGVERSKIVLAACACARTALKYIPEGEERPRRAIETAERYVRGETTRDEVIAARSAADAAAAAAYASAYAADAADAAYAAAAKKQAYAEMAVLVREHIMYADIAHAMEAL